MKVVSYFFAKFNQMLWIIVNVLYPFKKKKCPLSGLHYSLEFLTKQNSFRSLFLEFILSNDNQLNILAEKRISLLFIRFAIIWRKKKLYSIWMVLLERIHWKHSDTMGSNFRKHHKISMRSFGSIGMPEGIAVSFKKKTLLILQITPFSGRRVFFSFWLWTVVRHMIFINISIGKLP